MIAGASDGKPPSPPPPLPTSLTVASLLSSYAALHPGLVTGMVFLMIIYPLERVITPLYFGKMTEALTTRSPSTWKYMAVVAGMTVLMWIAENVNIVIKKQFSITMRGHVIREIMTYLCESKKCNVLALKSAYIITAMRNYSTNVIDTVNTFRESVIPGTVSAVAQIIFVLTMDYLLGILMALIMIVACIGSYVNVRVAIKGYKELYAYEVVMYELLDEILSNFERVMNHNMCPKEIEGVAVVVGELRGIAHRALYPVIGGSAVVSVVVITLIGLFFYRLYARFIRRKDKHSVSVATATITVVLQQLNVARNIISTVDMLTELFSNADKNKAVVSAWGAEQSACRAMDMVEDVYAERPADTDALEPAIDVRNVSFRFPTGDNIFKDLSLSIATGERVALIGPNGTGKSTLFKLIMRYLQPTQGTVSLFGVDCNFLSPEFVREHIGYVQQNVSLFDRSIEDNLLYGSLVTPQQLPVRLEKLGVLSYFDQFPHGIKTPVGKNGSGLSGGQRQMIHTIHVLLQDPLIFLFDEPTAATDAASSLLVADLIANIAPDKTVVLITHDPDLVSRMTRTIDLKQVVEQKKPQ
jgi:ABC-type multidrug transport system fused ATPase/permease subunit